MVEHSVQQRFVWRRHFNKLRWVTLCLIMSLLILLPLLHIYQSFVAAHAYNLLANSEKRLYDVMETITQPFITDPAKDLDAVKGTTWSMTLWGLRLSDPLAVLGQSAAGLTMHWPFVWTALLPVIMTAVFGRFFCGWICPATLIYELNSNFAAWLRWAGIKTGNWKLDVRVKYGVLALGLAGTAVSGSMIVSVIYPPAIVGREIYYAVALGGFGAGTVFLLSTLLFDLLVARRGFCRFLCPGGALYSMIGRYRLLRVRREVTICNDCAKCNAICEFNLDPMHDGFGQECNNCTACMAICPTDALDFMFRPTDRKVQGPGHLSRHFRHGKDEDEKPPPFHDEAA